MNMLLKGAAKRLVISLVSLAALSGCVAVPYGSPYYAAPGYEGAPVYRGPVYAAPAAVYVEPPVYFNFGFGYRGGRGGYYGGRHYRHW